MSGGGDPVPGQYDFALLLIQAKDLLESSHTVRTVEELTVRKNEFEEFVRKNYDRLQHSDMVRQLIAQYFMMHEYVGYHVEGAPATDIRAKYQKEVLNGVGSWLAILQPHLPKQQVLNYIDIQRGQANSAFFSADVPDKSGFHRPALLFGGRLLVLASRGEGRGASGPVRNSVEPLWFHGVSLTDCFSVIGGQSPMRHSCFGDGA